MLLRRPPTDSPAWLLHTDLLQGENVRIDAAVALPEALHVVTPALACVVSRAPQSSRLLRAVEPGITLLAQFYAEVDGVT